MRSCPLCKHGPVRHSIGTGTYWCANVQCPLYSAGFSADAWQALPRRDETAAEIARELEIALNESVGFDAPISRTWIVSTVARLRAIAAPGECDGVAQHRIKNLTNANAAAVARAEKAEAERDKAMAEAKDLGEALVYEGDHVNRLHRALKNTVQRWREAWKRVNEVHAEMNIVKMERMVPATVWVVIWDKPGWHDVEVYTTEEAGYARANNGENTGHVQIMRVRVQELTPPAHAPSGGEGPC